MIVTMIAVDGRQGEVPAHGRLSSPAGLILLPPHISGHASGKFLLRQFEYDKDSMKKDKSTTPT